MTGTTLLNIIIALLAIPVAIIALIYLIVPLFKAIAFVISQIFTFIVREIGDLFRLLGALITALFLIPLTAGNVVIGRWSAAAHFGRALTSEGRTALACLYRIAIGHPARLLCLHGLTEGIEHRLPNAVANAPTSETPNAPKSRAAFDGYTIVGSLPGGGSGGKLYIANPDPIKRAALQRQGHQSPDAVVIKAFSLADGSSLPQIVRESRALEAAKKLGLVLDHELTNERFYYVTRYVPGDSLTIVTQRLHALSGPDGLAPSQLRLALDYTADLLTTLSQYHRGGLWHKDVKPDNIIIDGQRAHLVDFGLVTPLRSGMTLTTHGTEYFRDPEMVRLALKGVKVHQVDGARFDVYAVGAVLYSLIENSFPAHGGLSQITKACPDALRWIVRRAMADYDKRYPTADAMLADLAALRAAPDPFALQPVHLPSFNTDANHTPNHTPSPTPSPQPPPITPPPTPSQSPSPSPAQEIAAAAATIGAASVKLAQNALRAAGLNPDPSHPQPHPQPQPQRRAPHLRVINWWSGAYAADPEPSPIAAPASFDRGFFNTPPTPPTPPPPPSIPFVRRTNRPAHEQLAAARARVAQRRTRAAARARSGPSTTYSPINLGVIIACAVVAIVVIRAATTAIDRAGVDTPAPPEPPATAAPPLASYIPAIAPAEPTAAPAPTPPTLNDCTILVISDIQPPTPSLTAAIARLKATGATILGTTTTTTAPAPELLDLEAAARLVRAMDALNLTAFHQRLAGWIADQDNLDAVVWFGPAQGQPGLVHAALVRSPAIDPHRAAGLASLTALLAPAAPPATTPAAPAPARR